MLRRIIFHFHDIINVILTVEIFILLYLIAAKVFQNISSLLGISTL